MTKIDIEMVAHDRVSYAVLGQNFYLWRCLLSAPKPGGIIPELFYSESFIVEGRSSYEPIATPCSQAIASSHFGKQPCRSTLARVFTLYSKEQNAAEIFFNLRLSFAMCQGSSTELSRKGEHSRVVLATKVNEGSMITISTKNKTWKKQGQPELNSGWPQKRY